MKKNMYIWIYVFGLVFLCSNAHAVLVDLNAKDVSDALAFDSLHKGTAAKDLSRLYCIDKKEGYGEYVTIRTKWHKLARMSSVCTLQKKGVPSEIQDEILNNSLLQIDITVYGYSLDFAREYRVTLKQDGKEITPEKIHADHSKNIKQSIKHLVGFPKYRAVIRCYFSYGSIQPDGSAALILAKDGSRKTFKVDLGAYK